nr:hypothetical protein [Occultella gossypii]
MPAIVDAAPPGRTQGTGKGAVGAVRDGEGLVASGQGIAHHAVVASGAQEDAHGRGVLILVPNVGVDPADVEPELAGVLVGGGADLELEHDEPVLDPVDEEQVDVEVVARKVGR